MGLRVCLLCENNNRLLSTVTKDIECLGKEKIVATMFSVREAEVEGGRIKNFCFYVTFSFKIYI